MSTVKAINSEEEYDAHVASHPSSRLHVLYFHAPWAEPCVQMSLILSTLASTYEPSDTSPEFISIDVEQLPDLSEALEVEAVPFVLLRRNNQTLETISGTDATRLRAAVENHTAAHSGANGTSARTQLPPAQVVTRPATQPAPPSNGLASHAPTTADAAPGGKAKDLSAYAPTASDPQTAPELTSAATGGKPGTTSPEELNQRLKELTSAALVMLFMKGTPSAPQCGFSRQLVSLLRENQVKYGFFNILADDEVRQGLKAFSEWPTFPQLYVEGEFRGGLDVVRDELATDSGYFDEVKERQAELDKAAAAKREAAERGTAAAPVAV